MSKHDFDVILNSILIYGISCSLMGQLGMWYDELLKHLNRRDLIDYFIGSGILIFIIFLKLIICNFVQLQV